MSKGSVLALDVGDARIGVAISDPLRILARPFGNFDQGKSVVSQIADVIKRESVTEIVIGLPKELSGATGPQAQKVLAFAEELKNSLAKSGGVDAPTIIFWDERLTTVEASRIVAGAKEKNRARRELLDRVAATLILESYLESKRTL